MAVKKTKTLAAVATVTNVTAQQFIPLSDDSGNTTKVSLANLRKSLLKGLDLNSINDGVFIMFHRNSDDFPLMVKPYNWVNYQNSGEIAEGVVVVEGGKILVVAPTETALYWSSANINGGGKTTSDRIEALYDWQGKINTVAQITHGECSGASYAPGFCAQYSRVNSNGKGLTAGKWWLPSLGELMMIYANMCKINYALSLIEGATPVLENRYWSSTEFSTFGAWYLSFSYGRVSDTTKSSNKYNVRAVSAFNK